MDVQKQREEFDRYFKGKYQEFHNEVFDDNGDDRAIIGYSFAWSAWQQAQKMAVPEGFILINKESLAFHARSIRMFNSGEHYKEEIEEHVCSIEAIIE